MPFHSGFSAYRFVLDRKEAAAKVPGLEDVIKKGGQLSFWWGGDRYEMWILLKRIKNRVSNSWFPGAS